MAQGANTALEAKALPFQKKKKKIARKGFS